MQRPSSERARSIGSAAAWVFAPLLAALAGVAVVPAAFHARLPVAPPLHQRWMATPTTVQRLRTIDPAVAALYFDRRGSYVLGGGLEAATAAASWADERQFEKDLAAGMIPPDVRAAAPVGGHACLRPGRPGGRLWGRDHAPPEPRRGAPRRLRSRVDGNRASGVLTLRDRSGRGEAFRRRRGTGTVARSRPRR